MENLKEEWKKSDINVESLWLIGERDKSGKHSNIYHGNFIPQIPNQLIRRYTKEGDTVLDIFMGSGTTLFECEKLNRNFIGFDINTEIISFVKEQMKSAANIKVSMNICDVTNKKKFEHYIQRALIEQDKEQVDFIIAHPPYMDIVRFTEQESDLSHISNLSIFLEKLLTVFNNCLPCLTKNKYFAIVIGDVYKKSEVIPLGFYVLEKISNEAADYVSSKLYPEDNGEKQ